MRVEARNRRIADLKLELEITDKDEEPEEYAQIKRALKEALKENSARAREDAQNTALSAVSIRSSATETASTILTVAARAATDVEVPESEPDGGLDPRRSVIVASLRQQYARENGSRAITGIGGSVLAADASDVNRTVAEGEHSQTGSLTCAWVPHTAEI